MKYKRKWPLIGKGKKAGERSIRVGSILFLGMFLFCAIASQGFPLHAFVSEKELKDIAPSLPYRIPFIDTTKILDIRSQITCSTALMSDGTLTQWGQCLPIPEDVKNADIVQIASGYTHMLALDNEGKVYGWGDNSHQEIEVLDSYTNIKEIQALDGVSALITKNNEVRILGNTSLYQSIPEELQGHIRDFALGIQHLGIVLDTNEVIILGNQGSEVAQVPEITSQIVDIQMNHEQVLLLDEEGNLLSWGNKSTIAPPTIPASVSQIAMSSHASFALSDGIVYGWGENTHAELAIPDAKFTSMYADTYHIYGIQESGKLVGWGQGSYVLGSDGNGRDMFTRLVHGGMVTMGMGLIACTIEAVIAIVVGCVSGLKGGWVDQVLMRIAEIIASIPFLPFVITIAAFLKDTISSDMQIVLIMVLLGCLSWVPLARIIRAQVLVEREKDYVWSAKIIGAKTFWILRKQILPQVMGLFLVNITLSYADTMLLESTLSFLGFGVQAPYPSWGNMLDMAQSVYVMENCWWQWVMPALCILLSVWSINLIGEGLRRRYNPKEEK